MSDQIQQKLSDSRSMRWTALILLAGAMFFAYIFVDILSPLQGLLQTQRGWDPVAYGHYAGSEPFLNVFVFFLIFAGIILDKMGVRFTAVLSGIVMVIGAGLNWFAVTDTFEASSLKIFMDNILNLPDVWWNITPWYDGMPASAKLAAIGFMVFGCGTEMAGITVSRGIVKWFTGHELALAMGVEMAIARLGVAVVVVGSPLLASINPVSVSRPVAAGLLLVCIALMMFIVYFFMDKKLDAQSGEAEEKDDPFKVSDIGKILSSKMFWVVALLCVLYYSAIFPFQKYAVNMLQCNIDFVAPHPSSFWASDQVAFIQYFVMLVVAATSFISNFKKGLMKGALLATSIIFLILFCYMSYERQSAESIFAVFPLLAVGITPILGKYVDNKGKAATMLMLGSILLIICHLTFAFVLPQFKGNNIGGIALAFVTILVLGSSFSLVPAALWPSVPKLVDSKVIGSAYALIFWIQNIGLWLFPLLIGKVLNASNPEIVQQLADGTIAPEVASVSYNYTNPLMMLASLGILALVMGFWLKIEDKRKGYGLEKPNITG